MSGGQVVVFILASIIVIAGAYYSTYFLATKTGKMKSGRMIKLRDRFSISKDKSICLLEVMDKVYLVAMTNQNVTLLDKLDIEEFETAPDIQQSKPTSGKYEPQGIIQKGLFGAYTMLKSSVLSDKNKNTHSNAKNTSRHGHQASFEEDNLDLVYKKLQSRRANSISVETESSEENFK